jgi:hypothetical protein
MNSAEKTIEEAKRVLLESKETATNRCQYLNLEESIRVSVIMCSDLKRGVILEYVRQRLQAIIGIENGLKRGALIIGDDTVYQELNKEYKIFNFLQGDWEKKHSLYGNAIR